MRTNALAIIFVIVLFISISISAKLLLGRPKLFLIPGVNLSLINKPIEIQKGSSKGLPGLNFSSPKAIQVSPFLPYQGKSCLISSFREQRDYFAYFPYKLWPMASLTKLMTAVVALENYPPHKEITISQEALDIYGNSANLKLGEKYQLEDLIKIMLITSSNDAAYAIAEDIPDFVGLMNKKAKQLSMNQTKYEEPSGLSRENISSARDVLKLTRYILKNYPQLFEITKKDAIIVNKKKFYNINQIRKLQGFLGGKTGYIPESKENAVSIFSLNHEKIILIVSGANSRLQATEKLFNWFKLIKLAEKVND